MCGVKKLKHVEKSIKGNKMSIVVIFHRRIRIFSFLSRNYTISTVKTDNLKHRGIALVHTPMCVYF